MRFGTMKGHLLLSVFLLLALSRNLDSFVFRPSVFAFRNAAISSSYRQRVAHSVRATPTGLVDDDESSVHLRLGEISATAITQTAVSQSELVIDEFVSCSDNITVVACVGNRTKLEILSKHLFGSNYSTNAGFRYNEVIVNKSDDVVFKRYNELWCRGLVLTQKRSLHAHFYDANDSERPSFEDTLHWNTRRMQMHANQSGTQGVLLDFLSNQLSISGHTLQHYRYDAHRNSSEGLSTLKNFAVWFREQFPYYYDQCVHCLNKQHNEYLGSVYPQQCELDFIAGRTELYACGTCGEVTRFPRFNDVKKVLDTRRGRCGEYSMLMLSFLEQLGYEARWVVDWENHVWTEVLVGARWVHLDPCEAAVDEPLIYESWGKTQTYIFAYTRGAVEDVTAQYTTRFNESLVRRLRDGNEPDELQDVLRKVRDTLNQQ